MRVLFQSVGILLSYNVALTKGLSRLGLEVLVDAESNLSRLFLMREKAKGFRPKLHFLSAISKYLPDSCLGNLLNNFDIIHINASSAYGKRIMKLSRRPKVFVLHSAPFTEEFYSEIGKFIDVFVSPSKFTLKREEPKIRKSSSRPTVVISHGVDTALFNDSITVYKARKMLDLPIGKKVILWNDRISPEKDLKTFLEAIPKIASAVPEAYFYIKGRANVKHYYKQIRILVRKLRSSNVRAFTGWMFQEQLPFLYRAADVFVRTSLYENFGLGYIEAMACGTPVVSSDIEVAREVVNDGGLFYKPRDPDDLAEKVIRVLTDRSLRERLASTGMKRVKEHFTSEIMARKYFQLYTSFM